MKTNVKNIAFIGNHLPRLCGIATFTTDICEAVSKKAPDPSKVFAVAMNNVEEGYPYPPRVRFEIRQGHHRDYEAAASYINHSDTQVVCLQHEYGIFGGDDGVFILNLLSRLKRPTIVTLHTVLKNPIQNQRMVIEELGRCCAALVVMSRKSVDILTEVYNLPPEKIHLIHHGIPDIPFVDSNVRKERFNLKGRPVLMTFGLLNPDKGVEVALKAIAPLVEKHPDLAYIVLGATHPELIRMKGEEYRYYLERLTEDLGLENNVLFHNRFVDLDTLVEYLEAVDIYITPYLNEVQVVSGSLAYSLGSGSAMVSSPYWYAEEVLADGRGFLFPFGDDIALGKILDRLLVDSDLSNRTKKAAYDFSRKMVWSEVANEYMALFEKVASADNRLVEIGASERPLLKPPELRLDHMVRLTDDTGILEHAKYVVPDRDHGYCLDDNARALTVASWAYHMTHESSIQDMSTKYLGFVKHAQREDGLFRNRLSYQREFMDDISPDDSIGRAIWALGYVVWRPALKGHRAVANECFDKAFAHIPKLNLRGLAFAAMGLSAYLKHFQNHELARRTLRETCMRIVDHYDNCADGDWNWFEEILVYDNAIVPCALFQGYGEIKEKVFLSTALSSLAFLDKVCFSSGNLRIVGNDGWYPKGGEMAAFDQQPVDATDFVLAYREAYRCTGEDKFLARMKRAFNWFLGRNDIGMPLYDFETAGCADGLTSSNISFNQGAESTVSFLMALLAMMEIPTSSHKPEG